VRRLSGDRGGEDAGCPPRSYTPKHLAVKILSTRAALEGDRKQVTVLFADVKDFTGLARHLDPEDMDLLMDEVFAILLDPSIVMRVPANSFWTTELWRCLARP
jgi:hypothetical protein